MAIQGIKNVDFIITATGEGVVNANGSFDVYNPGAGKVVKNHVFPKLRNLDPMQRLARQDGEGSMLFNLSDSALGQAQLIVSSECLRAGIFKDVSFGLSQVTVANVSAVLASLHGLVRGYLITEGGRNFARKSPLHVTDFECANPGLFFNQGSNSKVRGTENEKTALYSYFKTGKDIEYKGKASLSIEDLQFIPMENSLGRSAFDHQISISHGQLVAGGITEFLSDIAKPGQTPVARFVKKTQRIGAVAKVGDAGILLNDDALRVVIDQIIEMIRGLYIRQGKGYLQVTDVLVDYNDSNRAFRSEADPSVAVGVDHSGFAHYYAEVDVSDADYEVASLSAAGKSTQRAEAKIQVKADKRQKTQDASARKALQSEPPQVADNAALGE